jgi:pectate lyase
MSIINPSLASGILSFVSMLINTNRGKLRTPIFERYYKDILPIYMNTHRETLFFLTLFLFTPTLALANIPTGIQGFAASAGVTGGQGGQNIVVTNLNSSGPGSLKAAIEASGARYITFTPGLNGTINFTSYANAKSNMTIDGSGANIIISGSSLNIEGSVRNIIIHNLTFANTTSGTNAIFIRNGGRDVWIDHNTFRANNIDHGQGQGVAVYTQPWGCAAPTGNGVTISWNHWMAPNTKALLIGADADGCNSPKVSLHHNWFDRITSRSPRIHHPAIVHMWNNYCSNWGNEYCAGSGDRPDFLVENNIFENSANRYAVLASYANLPSNSVTVSGNLLLGSPSPVMETRGTFPRSQINYSYTPEVADNAFKQRITQCAGASITVCGTETRAPTVVMTAPANGTTVSGSSVAVSANASDNVGVSGVQFKLDGANLGAEDTVSPYSVAWNTTAAANSSHTLTAVARNAAGNSTTSASVSVTVNNAAAGPPTVSMTAPASGATVSGTAVTVTATASNNVGVAGVQFKLDGANLGAEDATSPYSVTWNSTTASNGSHTLTAVARDAAGNTTTSAGVSVTVNNTGPSLPDVIVTSLSYAGGVFTSTVKNQGTAATPAGIAIGVGYSVDGVYRTWGAVNGPLAAGASVTIGTNGGPYTIPNGTHTITANVDDNNRFAESNETNNLLSQPITVGGTDTQAPTVSMTAPANGTTVSGSSVTVSANASDNVGVSGVQFKLDGANLGAEDTASPYSVTWSSATAAVGSHTLTAVARDAAGNTTTSAGVSVTVPDATSPTVSFSAPANGAPVSGSVTVSANASDNVGVSGVQFKLDGANLGAEDITAPYSIVWNSTTATIGSHTLTAVARDAAGNIGTSAGVTVTVKSGPISLWKLDESSGATASDFSGTNTATLSGGASCTAGRLGNALKLNGIDGQAKANTTKGLNLTQAITIAAWVKYEDLGAAGYRTVVMKGSDSARGFGLNIYNGYLNFVKVGLVNVPSTVAVPTGAFHHVAVTWDALAGQAKFYLDGTLAQTVSNTTAIVSSLDSDPLTIGSWLTGGSWCNGLLDDVRIYNRALSTTEVATLATPPAPDTTPRSASITAPASGATGSGTSVTVSATAPSVPTGSVSPGGLRAPSRIRLLASLVSNAAAEGKP